MKKRATLGLAMVASSATMALQAQDMQDTMVVVGSRTPTQISQIPGAVWVIEKEELQQQVETGADLKTALGRLVPGLDMAPQGRTNHGQNLRGRTVQVLVDGVSMNGSRGLSRQFDAIDPFNIERIEVLSGASSLYGGGATGGIINIVTRKGRAGGPDWRTEAGVTTGVNHSDDLDKRIAQSVSGGNDRVQAYLGTAFQDNGRQFDAGGDEIFPDIAQTDLQDNRSIDVLGNLTFNLDDDQILELGAQLYRSGYEGDRGVYFPHLAADSPSLEEAEIRDGYRSDRDPATDRKMVNLQYHHGDLLGQNFYLQAFHRQEEASFQAFPYPTPDWQTPEAYDFAASKQNTRLSGLKALFDARLTDSVGLTYGLDLDRESFDASQMTFDRAVSDATGGLVQEQASIAPRYPGYRVDSLAAFAQTDWQATDALKLSAGIRRQHSDVEVDDFNGIPGGENDYDATLLNASALYDYGNGHQNWLRYSQGFELPDPAKYYGRPGISVDGNPLSAIETDQVELGWRYRGGDWVAQAAAYYAWSDKALEINSGDLSVDVIDDSKRDYGLEGALTRYFDNGVEAGGTLHLVRSERENDAGEWEKRDARDASLSSATAFVGWRDRVRSARLQANHAFDLEDDADRKIDGNTTLDLSLSRQTDVGTFSLGVQNLLDESYSTVWGQRAAMFYSPYYGPEYLYDYQGRGRTYTLTWSMDY
ncbi:TonB-dependent receptor [Halomonas heilongjiangensis]|uniref:TonB-dependent siderophore receptor n=1 Tax=Halomonas heilongjiangensis TaxID=1387883 RepID=A0A2N7THA2_9GAMM|nr:TonB-dependent receptor [Halomonas heilongjiangensis]PMR67572.1 TonB-dependent siderophore receptor [Halomonas heilongjiangensis]PXX86765.1 TonB-dependent siderophore receptor [Halomonas heilongjiangensis]